jgi:hypothetical protein
MLKYFASIYPLGASVLEHLIILECPTSGHLTQFLNFLSNPHPLPALLAPFVRPSSVRKFVATSVRCPTASFNL